MFGLGFDLDPGLEERGKLKGLILMSWEIHVNANVRYLDYEKWRQRPVTWKEKAYAQD
jgi:hypothetical protein